MKVLNIPFNLVLLCVLTPLLGDILDISLFNLPFLILASITLIIILGNNYKFKIEYDLLFITFLITMISLILNVLLSRGFTILAMGGYVIIFSFLFQNIYFLNKKLDIKNILSFFNFFYKWFLIILVLEFCLVFFGYQPFLGSFLEDYKTYNSNDIAKFFFPSKFGQTGGLNSIFLGSQLAATMSLLSFIWFNLTKKLNYFYNLKEFTFWKYLSLLLFIFTITGTNFILLLVFLFLSGFKYNKNLNYKLIFLFISVVLFFLVIYLIENNIIYSRIFNIKNVNLTQKMIDLHDNWGTLDFASKLTTYEYYIWSFLRPVSLWYEQSLLIKLFGSGNSIDGIDTFVGGDFAYGTMLLFGGFLFTFFFTALMLKFLFNFLNLKFNNQFEEKIFQYFSLVVILLFFSLIHWGQVITNSGIILYFAFHISLVNLIIKNKVKFKTD